MCFKRSLLLLVALLWWPMPLTITARAQQPGDTLRYRPMEKFPYVLRSPYEVQTPPAVSDSLFNALAKGLTFRVGRTEVASDDPFFIQLRDSLLPLFREQQLRLGLLMVRGAASPEGPLSFNRYLSQARMKRLLQWMDEHLPALAPDSVVMEPVAEDYDGLLYLMQQESDPDYHPVQSICHSASTELQQIKRQLKALDGGRVWSRLLRHYFPRLRQARLLLWVIEAPQLADVKAYPRQVPAAMAYSAQPLQPLLQPLPAVEPATLYERRHLIALRTNLLHDFFYMPGFGWAPSANVQLEYYPLSGHYTYNAGFTFSNHHHWTSQEFFQIRDLRLELRRYFRGGGRFMGPFLSAYAEGTVYGFGLSETKGWEGEGGGAGLGGGYVMKLNRKGSLRLELTLDLGIFITKYDPYVYGNPITGDKDGDYYYDYTGNASQFNKRNRQFTWVGPTNAGIHLTYDIVYRKKRPVGYYSGKGGLR